MTQINFVIDYSDKLDFSDVIFFIPYRGTDKYRSELLVSQIRYLASIIDTPKIYILEAAESPTLTISGIDRLKTHSNKFDALLSFDLDDGAFYKTKYLNILLRNIKRYFATEYKFVCVLDYDVFLFPDAYDVAYKYLKKMRELGGRGVVTPHAIMVYLNSSLSNMVKEKDISYLLEFQATVNAQHPGGIQFFTIEALEGVNGWNEELYLGGEDYEIAHRISVIGGFSKRFGSVAYHLFHPVIDWKYTTEYKEGLNVIGEVSGIVDMDKMTEYITTKMRGCDATPRI